MKRISSSGGSPHVVQMVGCVTITEPFCLLTEFVEYGDLLNYLKYIRLMVLFFSIMSQYWKNFLIVGAQKL